jgi:hypothetical protein
LGNQLGNQSVQTNASTIFSGGLPDEIVAGVKLEVEGSLAGGVLTASKVEFKDSIKIESNVMAASGSTITALDGLGAPGVTVIANAFTRIKTKSDNVSPAPTVADLAPLVDRSVRIRGRASATDPTAIIATEIEDRGAADRNVSLQAVAENIVSTTSFTLLGVLIDTSSLEDSPLSASEFRNIDETGMTRTAFFGEITPNGGLVKAQGRLSAVLAGGFAFTPTVSGGDGLREVELEN